MSKTYQDKAYLEEQYVNQEHTMQEIANLHGVNVVTIMNWLKKHGIDRRDTNSRDAGYRDKDTLIKQYVDEKMTMAEIANFYHVSASVINDWIKKFEIKSRQAGHQPGNPMSEKQREANIPNWEAMKGRKLSEETKLKLRMSKLGERNHNYGKRVSSKGRYWIVDPKGNYVCMRSNWEVNYSSWLSTNGYVDWSYEPQTFVLNDGSAYTPDFWVPKMEAFIEVKGWMREEHQKKIDLFRGDYPQFDLVIANRDYLVSIGCDLKTKHDLNKPKNVCKFCKCEFLAKYRKQKTCSVVCRNKYVVQIRQYNRYKHEKFSRVGRGR